MGMSYYKSEYICDCGEEWGCCEKKSGFIMAYNSTVDIGVIYQYHGRKSECIGGFTDKGLAAFQDLFEMNNKNQSVILTEEELKITNK